MLWAAISLQHAASCLGQCSKCKVNILQSGISWFSSQWAKCDLRDCSNTALMRSRVNISWNTESRTEIWACVKHHGCSVVYRILFFPHSSAYLLSGYCLQDTRMLCTNKRMRHFWRGRYKKCSRLQNHFACLRKITMKPAKQAVGFPGIHRWRHCFPGYKSSIQNWFQIC